MRKVPRKVIPEGRQILRKVLAEGFCGRLRGRLFYFFARDQFFLLQRVPWKIFAEGFAEGFGGRLRRRFFVDFCSKSAFFIAEGSAEGICGRFRGRFLRKVPRKVPGRFSRKVEKLILS